MAFNADTSTTRQATWQVTESYNLFLITELTYRDDHDVTPIETKSRSVQCFV